MNMPSNTINTNKAEENKLPAADTGNASNPSPKPASESVNSNQLLNEKAEKYLRESGNIEDMPDAEDQAQADKIIERE
jgi:hypothetical protein